MSGLRLEPFCSLRVEVGASLEFGRGGCIQRRFVPITGGAFKGVIGGAVLPGGGDWQSIAGDEYVDIEAHYVLQTEAGELIEAVARGKRSLQGGAGASTYFRTAMQLTSQAPLLRYLNGLLFVTSGERRGDHVGLQVFILR